MNELIPISNHNGKKAVSARVLYEFLGYSKSQWKRWYTGNIINNQFAAENDDWTLIDTMSNPYDSQDFALSIPFAKKLSMLARTEKGEQARQYFIECERIAKGEVQHSLPQTYSQALRELADKTEQNELLRQQVAKQEPLVHFAKSVEQSNDCISVAEMAQILKQNKLANMGQTRFYNWLRYAGYVNIRGARRNLPTQKSIDMGIMKIAESVFNEVHINRKTVITGYGQQYFIRLFRQEKERRGNKYTLFG